MNIRAILLGTAVASLLAGPALAGDWWQDTKVSGRMYFDVSNIEHKSDGVKESDTGTGFDLKRFYVGIDHKFTDMFSANLTTDVTYDGTAAELYVKKAYLDINIDPALDVRLGATDLPWVPFAEDMYGYRYVENTLIDRTKFGTSSDWGVHFKGAFADGLLNYALSVVNGAGYKKPGTIGRSKGVDVEGRVSANYEGFTVGIGGYTGKLGHDIQGSMTHHTATRFDAIAAYHANGFHVGVEYFSANDWNSVTSSSQTDKENGWSGFAAYQFDPEWALFGRYDWVQVKTEHPCWDAKPRDGYYNVGIEWTPTKIVNLSLVYKHDSVKHGYLSTSNGTIGGDSFWPDESGTYNEIGIFGQFRW